MLQAAIAAGEQREARADAGADAGVSGGTARSSKGASVGLGHDAPEVAGFSSGSRHGDEWAGGGDGSNDAIAIAGEARAAGLSVENARDANDLLRVLGVRGASGAGEGGDGAAGEGEGEGEEWEWGALEDGLQEEEEEGEDEVDEEDEGGDEDGVSDEDEDEEDGRFAEDEEDEAAAGTY